MRRALATVTVAGAVALVPFTAAPAAADDQVDDAPRTVVAQAADDADEYGDWGLLGLTGLFGLFGYKKYKDYRAASRRTARAEGTDETGGTSRRV